MEQFSIGSTVHVLFCLSLIAQHRRCPWRSRWFLPASTQSFTEQSSSFTATNDRTIPYRFNSPCTILTLDVRTTTTLAMKVSMILPNLYWQHFTESSQRFTATHDRTILYRFNSRCVISTLVDRTTPSLPERASMIRPSLYSPRFIGLSISHTILLSLRFRRCSYDRFDLWFHCGRYSRVQFFPTKSAYVWTFWRLVSDDESV